MATDIEEQYPPPEELDGIPEPEELGYKIIPDPYVDITGFEYVRNDSSELTGMLQRAIFDVVLMNPFDDQKKAEKHVTKNCGRLTDEAQELIVDGLMSEETIGKVQDIVDQIYEDTKNGRYHPMIACRGPSVNAVEDLYDEYKQPPIAARAGAFTHRFFDDVNIEPGDDVYYLYVKSTGYNHDGRKLPEEFDQSKALGIVEGMEPPQAQVQCLECGEEWTENEFGKKIQETAECPGCGHSAAETVGSDDPFEVDGCFVNWEKHANKAVKEKTRKVLKHLDAEEIVDSIGGQDTFASF